jgi:hypothetical protein
MERGKDMKHFFAIVTIILLMIVTTVQFSISEQYPWESIYIQKGNPPRGVTVKGDVVDVLVNLDKNLTTDELKSLMKKVNLVDETGEKYSPFSYIYGHGAKIKRYDKNDQLIFSWDAKYIHGFQFEIKSKSTTYFLHWADYPPLYIGSVTPFFFSKGGDKVEDNSISIVLNKIERMDVLSPDKVAELNIKPSKTEHDYIVIHLTISRVNNNHVVDCGGYKKERSTLIDSEGHTYEYLAGRFNGVELKDPNSFATTDFEFKAGASGFLIFEVPKKFKPVNLNFIYTYVESFEKKSQMKKRLDITL